MEFADIVVKSREVERQNMKLQANINLLFLEISHSIIMNFYLQILFFLWYGMKETALGESLPLWK